MDQKARSIYRNLKNDGSAMLRYFKDQFYGNNFEYYIFWDNQPRAVGQALCKHSLISKLTVYPINFGHADSRALERGLREIGYTGEGIDIILFGPACFESIREVENRQIDIGDWIVANKATILPRGVSDDEMRWDYIDISSQGNRYFCLAVTKLRVLDLIEGFTLKHNIRVNTVYPLLGLALRAFGFDRIISSPGFPLQIPGFLSKLRTANSSRFLSTTTLSNTFEPTSQPIEAILNNEVTVTVESLSFVQFTPDTLQAICRKSFRYFRVLFITSFILALIVLGASTFLAFNETGKMEKMAEMHFLNGNLENIAHDISILREQIGKCDSLNLQKTQIASYLSAVGAMKPENIWWRRVEYKEGKGLSIEGFCIGETEAAIFQSALQNAGYWHEIRLCQILKFQVPVESPIPPKYRSDIYRFKLVIRD